MRYVNWVVLCVLFCFIPITAFAGSLDSPAAPTSAVSAMFTVEDIYNRLNAGTAGAKRAGAFTEPSSGPTAGTGYTLDEVMGKAPSVDDTNGAGLADVLSGKTFWGLTSGAWGTKTGTMTNNGAGATITPRTSDQTLAAGYWSSANTVSGDTDLVTGNIRSGVSIFSVSGDSNVVNTSSGDAVAGDILTGKKAWVDGSEVTGNVSAGSNVSGADGSKTFTIPNGLYSGSKTATANDTDLTAGNIKDNVVIFGVTGTFPSDGTAVAGEVKDGSTFYTSSATKLTGTGTKTLSAANDTVAAGYYAATTLSAVDTDLAVGNIKKDVDIFGVTGTYPLAGVEKTGQTASYGTGSDGNLQKGVSWPNPRFTDNSDGTVTDNLTGLIWLKNANCFGKRDWATALTDSNNLEDPDCGLTEGSSAGDWRLPNVKELLSLIDWGQSNPAFPSVHPFTDVWSISYWSSTTDASSTGNAWLVYLGSGGVYVRDKTLIDHYVWPVRGGQ